MRVPSAAEKRRGRWRDSAWEERGWKPEGAPSPGSQPERCPAQVRLPGWQSLMGLRPPRWVGTSGKLRQDSEADSLALLLRKKKAA